MRLIIFLILVNVGFSSELDERILHNTQKFKTIYEYALKYHRDSINVDSLFDYTMKQMLGSLDDYSTYYDLDETRRMKERQSGREFGLGFKLLKSGEKFYVLSVSDELKNGIKTADELLAIDDIDISKIELDSLNSLITGKSGSSANVKLKDSFSDEIKEFAIERKYFPNTGIDIHFEIEASNLLFVKIDNFNNTTVDEFVKIYGKQNDKLLVIDLRDNPGGNLEDVVEFTDLFLDSNKVVTKLNSNSDSFGKSYYTKQGKIIENELIVLVNKRSMSASEIFAGAIQDHDRGLVVGETTFGKGTVQNIWNLTDSSAFKLTVAEYLTPSGRPIEVPKGGDVSISDADKLNMNEEERKVIEDALKGGVKEKYDIYETVGGRKVIATGGVRPDVVIEQNTQSELFNLLLKYNLFYEYALINILDGKVVGEDYTDYKDFEKRFAVGNEMVQDFAKFIAGRRVWNEEMFKTDLREILIELKSSFAYFLFGKTAEFYTRIPADNQLIKALNSRNEIKIISNTE